MHAGHSELFKTLEAGIFALSLILLAIAQSSTFHLHPALQGVDSVKQASSIADIQ